MMMRNSTRRLRRALAAATLSLAILSAGAVAIVADPFIGVAAAQDAGLQAEGKAAVETWIAAVASGDEARVKAVSAPEFQIVRGDGSAHDLATYLVDLPVLTGVPAMKNVFVTGTADTLVVRYTVDAVKDVDGTIVDAFGPRLTVLRKQDGKWLVMAHSNFSTVAQDQDNMQ